MPALEQFEAETVSKFCGVKVERLPKLPEEDLLFCRKELLACDDTFLSVHAKGMKNNNMSRPALALVTNTNLSSRPTQLSQVQK